MSNSTPKCLALDSEMKRLYVGTLEGLLLIFNISSSPKKENESAFTLVHTISFDHAFKVS